MLFSAKPAGVRRNHWTILGRVFVEQDANPIAPLDRAYPANTVRLA
jgi:hypothetical protein